MNERAKLSLNFDDDDALPDNTRAEIDRKIQEISEESGFVSKAPAVKSQNKSKSAKPKTQSVKKRRTRAKTGRTYPFNTKIKPEIYDLICNIADTSTLEEGRPVSLAEVIERAVAALEIQRSN